jgi:integrase
VLALTKLPLPRIRFHDLRHTHATLGLAAGVPPKVMSDRLGHATVAFTQDVYMHAIPQLEEESAAQVANLIFGVSGRPPVRTAIYDIDEEGNVL